MKSRFPIAGFLAGLGLGAIGMFFLVQRELIPRDWNPLPLIYCWVLIVVAGLLGPLTSNGSYRRIERQAAEPGVPVEPESGIETAITRKK